MRLDEVAEAMQQVTVNSTEIGKLSEQVSLGSDDQTRGIEQISRAILQIQEVTQKTSSNAEKGAAAGAQMQLESEHLNTAVQRLRNLLGLTEMTRVEAAPVPATAPAAATFESLAEDDDWR